LGIEQTTQQVRAYFQRELRWYDEGPVKAFLKDTTKLKRLSGEILSVRITVTTAY
jgi:hypothetical protein